MMRWLRHSFSAGREYVLTCGPWGLLWAGLNTAPVLAGGWSSPLETFHRFRGWLPVAAGGAAVLWLIEDRERGWACHAPLGYLVAYGLIGLIASCTMSPSPAVALYWAAAYLAVPAVLLSYTAAPAAAAHYRRIINLNWAVIGAIGLLIFAVAWSSRGPSEGVSLYNVLGPVPSVGGMPMVRPTGIARYAGVAGIVALARSLAGTRRLPRCLWGLGVACAASALWCTQSVGSTVAFGVGVVTVLLLSGYWRLVAWTTLLGALAVTQAPALLEHLTRAKTASTWLSGRIDIWRTGIELLPFSPLVGLGFHADRLLLEWPYKNHISNAPIHALVQAGMLGGLLFVSGWAAAWRLLLRHARRAVAARKANGFLIELAGVLAFFTVRAAFESSGAFYGVDWLLVAPVVAYLGVLGREAATRHVAADEEEVTPSDFGTVPLPALRVLGVRFHPVSMDDTIRALERWIAAGARGRWVAATGLHGVLEAYRDPTFQAVLEQADLFVPDGYSLVWLARRQGARLPSRVCGADLLRAFCAVAARRGYRVLFYGDTDAVLGQLTQRLAQDFPGLQVAGAFSPPFRPVTPAEDDEVVRAINAAAPDVVWVGLGLPKQERWIVEHRQRLNAPVLVAVGAAFKFVSGSVARAPRWAGEHGLEWLWRFLQEPRRLWRRALLDVPWFIVLVLLERLGVLRTGRDERPWHEAAFKRAFDIALSAVGLVLSLPLWSVFACLIKLEDGGPVFYAQERVGQGGRRFPSFKFRTMVPDADARYGPRQAAERDERITRAGRLLRATAMDELPQLWNILRGDMSFVGPRALAPGEIEVVGDGTYVPLEAVPGYAARHQVRPGLTGITQVFTPRDLPRKKKFRYDRLYIARQDFWLDLRLIVLSFWITFRGKWETRAKKL